MEKLIKDLRFAIRTLLRAPGFSVVVVISIALGFAANVTVFSIANGLLWGVLPVNDPGRMVMFTFRSVSNCGSVNPVSDAMVKAVEIGDQPTDFLNGCAADSPNNTHGLKIIR